MSIASYRRNVSRGVTNQFTPTCFPAAFEKISPSDHLTPDVYLEYREYIRDLGRFERQGKSVPKAVTKSVLTDIALGLGEMSYQDFEFEAASKLSVMKRVVGKFLRHDYRVALDLGLEMGSIHTVGLIPVDETSFRLVSNQVPHLLRGIVQLENVYPYLRETSALPLGQVSMEAANITALPPSN